MFSAIIIILLVIIVVAMFRAMTRMHYANTKQAERHISSGHANKLPSWLKDKDEIQVFLNGVYKLVEREGIPLIEIQLIMLDERVGNSMMLYAGELEALGSSFAQQQIAVADKLIELYNSVE